MIQDDIISKFGEFVIMAAVRKSTKNAKPILQSNILISARDDLTRDQRRLVYLFLRQIHKENKWPVGGKMEFNFKTYAETFNVCEQEARDDLRKAIKGLRGKYVRFYEDWGGDESEREIDWTTERRSSIVKGRYEITMNYALKEFMMPLAANIPFSVLDLDHISVLQSNWSQRLYQALWQWRLTGVFVVNDLNTLHTRWETPASYQKYGQFKRRVLLPAIEEVRKLDILKDLTMVEKTCESNPRKVTGLQFLFTPFEKE